MMWKTKFSAVMHFKISFSIQNVISDFFKILYSDVVIVVLNDFNIHISRDRRNVLNLLWYVIVVFLKFSSVHSANCSLNVSHKSSSRRSFYCVIFLSINSFFSFFFFSIRFFFDRHFDKNSFSTNEWWDESHLSTCKNRLRSKRLETLLNSSCKTARFDWYRWNLRAFKKSIKILHKCFDRLIAVQYSSRQRQKNTDSDCKTTSEILEWYQIKFQSFQKVDRNFHHEWKIEIETLKNQSLSSKEESQIKVYVFVHLVIRG